VWQVRNALHSGKAVKLQVLHNGQTKRDDFTVQPATFHPIAVTNETMSGIGYIKIPYFEKGTAQQFRDALADVHKRGVRKLIIDVRGNAAGDVEEAIAAADELLTSGLITSLEGRRIEAKRWNADRATAYDGEVEVLTDISTASGGEVFAAAIHGNSRGKLVGITTYGKAIQQKFIPLPSGGGVQMTVAHYTTPDLKPIKETGVRPDVIVDLTAQVLSDAESKKKPAQREDLILQKALQLFGAKEPAAKKAA
ncbi:MAG TPA: S41 family peptidase, partial [Thermoanaerobaculia bacterium]|nr:S41 family peptidase [Thermoanaerobaculia bacterium]